MVKFECAENNFVYLKICDYEFPKLDKSADEYEKNWLQIEVQAKYKDLEWSRTTPALLTWEVQELADWFRELSRNQKTLTYSNQRFTEPCITFELLNKITSQKKKLRIGFNAEFCPLGWDNEQDEFITLTLEVDNAGLAQMADELETELAQFSER